MKLKTLIISITLFVAGLFVMLFWLERHLIYFPVKYPQGTWDPPFEIEDAWFDAEDGTHLHGWHVKADNPSGTILYCHGNAGNLSDRHEIVRVLTQLVGVNVMIFDYRGYGRSEGSPNEKGTLMDARAARGWLTENKNIETSKIILLGRSLGGGVAVDLAASDGARGLILESTFTSLPELASEIYPIVPKAFVKTKYDSISKIKGFKSPLFHSHGDRDEIIPFEMGRRLFDEASEPKRWVTITGGDHNTMPGRDYYEQMKTFVESL